jgi:diacyltrehalose acyltransferase
MSKNGAKSSSRNAVSACPVMKARCASRVAGGLAVFAAVLPLVAVSPTAGAASVPPFASPATVLTMGDVAAFQGAVCRSPNSCTLVYYPWFVTPLGVTALQDAVTTTSANKIIVFGYSNGALVAEQWLEQHLNDPNIPSSDVLSFVVIGNPAREWPQSPYQVIDVSRQYDAASDYPNNPASPYYLLAIMNAGAGFWINHLNYRDVNLDDPANAVWTVGNTTYVLTPSPNLPILLGLAPFFPSLNEQLKAAIETAYIRPVPFPPTIQPATPATSSAADPELSTSVVSDPTVAPQHTTVPLSLAPAPTTPTATGLNTTNSTDTGAPAAGTVPTTPPAVPADMVQTITPAAAMPGLDNLIGQTRSTTAPTTRTPTSTANGNMVVPSQINGMRVKPRESRGPRTRDDVHSGETVARRGNHLQAGTSQDPNGPESGAPE